VLVNGVETRDVRDGAELEVVGDQSAVIRLADDARAELAPASRAVIQGSRWRTGPVVKLNAGSGEFQVQDRVHVETPLGDVSALATQFFVGIRPVQEPTAMGTDAAAAMIVAVLTGNVQVRHDDHRYALQTGDNRVYGSPRSRLAKAPDFTARVIDVADEGRSLVVEVPPGRPGEKPARRLVMLGDSTRISYVNVPLRAEKPMAGYTALVWLSPDAPDTAAAVTFKGKKQDAPRPDVIGRVASISSDGRKLTLELPPKKKEEKPQERSIVIDQDTRKTFALVPFFRETPEVGQQAIVWLAAGSSDHARMIAFRGKNSALPSPDLMGRITAVSADGKTITLNPPPKKGEKPTGVAVHIQPSTRFQYVNLDKGQQKPAPGLNALVWLQKGTPDRVFGIRLVNPAKQTDPAEKAFFTLPPEAKPSGDQGRQVAGLIEKLTPEYRLLARRRDALLSPDQKAAMALTRKAAQEAGLKDPRQIQEAVQAAAGITPDQKKRLALLANEEKALRQRFRREASEILKADAVSGQPAAVDSANR
jgi:hypothetical protein